MASLLDLTRNVSRLTRPTYPAMPDLSRPPTQYETEMRYFAEPRREEEVRERKRRPLLQVIFDILQTGNYMSANVANSVVDSVKYGRPLGESIGDALSSAWKGLTWQDKNTFSDVIRQNAEEHGQFLGRTHEEWTKEVGDVVEGKTKLGQLINKLVGQSTPAARVGFLGDVFLDPLTYANPLQAIKPGGMATRAAVGAAQKYAPDVVKLRTAARGLEDLKGLAKTGVDDLGDILARGGRTMARENEQLYNQAFRRALREPGEKLQAEMKGELGDVLSAHAQKTFAELQTSTGAFPASALHGEPPIPGGMEDLIKSIESGYGTAAGGAGERGMRILGRERFKSVRDPNRLARGVESIGKMIGDVPGASKLANAWWSWVNGPTIAGGLRKFFGVRNPYQKHLNLIRNDARGLREQAINKFSDFGNSALTELGDDLTEKAIGLRGVMEQVEFGLGKSQKQAELSMGSLRTVLGDRDVYKVQDVLRGMDIGNIDAAIKVLKERGLNTKVFDDIKALGINSEDATKISEFWDSLDGMFKTMREKEVALIDEGVFATDSMGEWVNYIPKVQNRPAMGKKKGGKLLSPQKPGFMEETRTTFRQSERQGMELAKEFFGDWIEESAKNTGRSTDDAARAFIEAGNLAPVSTNLVEMVNARILAHARVVARGDLVKQLSQFGMSIDDLGKYANTAVNRMGGIYNELIPVQDQSPIMKGLLFDKDVADIVNKTFAIAASDDTMQGMKKAFLNFTSWWKGLATATTGFHMRNFFSNNVTGIFRHGSKWLNAKKHFDSMVGVYYALHPSKYLDLLKNDFLEINEGMVQSVLGKEIGGKSIKYWADKAREDGIISLKTMIGDVTKEVKPKVSMGKRLDPFSREFVLPAGSRKVGTAIENQARFHSYLLSIDELSTSGLPGDAVANFAKIDTKKWFIDYGDLSEAEQKYMKNIIPFYTWMRKNLANQISGMMVMPDAYRMAAKVEDAISIDDFDYSLVPEYMKELGFLPIGEGEKGPTMWWPNLPYGDLNKIPLFFEDGIVPKMDIGAMGQAIKEEFGSSSHPLIKTVMQSLTQTNLFRQRDYLDEVPAPIGQVFAQQPKVVAFLDKAMKAMGFENGAGIRERDGKLVIDEAFEQIMTNNVPLLRTVAKMFDGLVDATGLEEVLEEATGRQDAYEGMEDLFQNLSFFFGLKYKEVDEEYQLEQFQREVKEAAEKDRQAWKRTLPGYEQRSIQSRLQNQAQNRRIGL